VAVPTSGCFLQGFQMVCFQTKNPNFGGSCNGRCGYMLWTFCIFYSNLVYVLYGHLVYVVVIC
jgi:hypothetical protein